MSKTFKECVILALDNLSLVVKARQRDVRLVLEHHRWSLENASGFGSSVE